MKSLSKHLSGRTWPDSDKALVTACFKLLSAISCKTLTASFTDRGSQQQQQQVRQPGSGNSTSGGNGSVHMAHPPHTTSGNAIDAPMHHQPGTNTTTSSSTDGIQHFLKQQEVARLEMQPLPVRAGAPAGADVHYHGDDTGSYGSSGRINSPPSHAAPVQHNYAGGSNSGNAGPQHSGSSGRDGGGSKPAGNRFDATPTHSIGSVVTLKFKPSGTPPTAAESRGPKALQWVEHRRHKRQQSKQARAITAQQMVELPLFQELQAALREHRGNRHGG